MEASEFIVKFYIKEYEDQNLEELTQSPVCAISGVSSSSSLVLYSICETRDEAE